MKRHSSSPNTESKPRRALVLGASMAGLLTAAVISGFFDEVVVIDRDDLPDAPVARRGVPQARHLHGLLPRGVRALANVSLVGGARAHELSARDGRVCGVRVHPESEHGELQADLVVDARGRAATVEEWLAALGAPVPPRSEVKVDVGYWLAHHPDGYVVLGAAHTAFTSVQGQRHWSDQLLARWIDRVVAGAATSPGAAAGAAT